MKGNTNLIKKNVLVTGAGGQLASEIHAISQDHPKYNFIFTNRLQLDITHHDAVREFIDENNIKVIINCAAYTQVDKAEEEPDLADAINHLAVANLAQIAKDLTLKLIHISTDYVFDGTNQDAYLENDTPNPQTVYGQSKLDGEIALQKINPTNSIIIRTSWVYSKYGHNFVKSMLRLAKDRDVISVVSDQLGSPTNAGDLAQAIVTLIPQIKNDSVQVFHYSNKGVCSWHDFAKAIFEIKKLPTQLKAIKSSEYPTSAKRPSFSVLDKSKIKTVYGIDLLDWKSSLTEFLRGNSWG